MSTVIICDGETEALRHEITYLRSRGWGGAVPYFTPALGNFKVPPLCTALKSHGGKSLWGNGNKKRIHNYNIFAWISATYKGFSDIYHLVVPPQPFEVSNIHVYLTNIYVVLTVHRASSERFININVINLN